MESGRATTYHAFYADQARRAATKPMARGHSTPVRSVSTTARGTATVRASSTSAARGLAVVAAAARQAGKPYVFGAAGPKAFDCSGLTLYVFRQFGVRLPHRANLQRSYGVAVSRANARPGDLIIFMRNGYGYHAALYAGGGYMWDAPSRGGRVGKHKIWSSSIIFRRLV
jgi:cell wall-associated NlpC family hydrolase